MMSSMHQHRQRPRRYAHLIDRFLACPSDLVPLQRMWPADFYAVDVVPLLRLPELAKKKRIAVKKLFDSKMAGQDIPYRSSTFYEHVFRWRSATQAQKDAFLAKGRTNEGLWSRFMDVVPGPKKREDQPECERQRRRARERVTGIEDELDVDINDGWSSGYDSFASFSDCIED
ncbi:hypothetical protein K474DRAFT_1668334 [Panus rudis PR-1116 ss-1]|nr:hypothetical protein K474DRAFT_1668334 [Panus rudis PR-1116 ss-1]